MNNRPALGDYAPTVYRPRPFDGMVQTGPPRVWCFDRPSGLRKKANGKSGLLQAQQKCNVRVKCARNDETIAGVIVKLVQNTESAK